MLKTNLIILSFTSNKDKSLPYNLCQFIDHNKNDGTYNENNFDMNYENHMYESMIKHETLREIH